MSHSHTCSCNDKNPSLTLRSLVSWCGGKSELAAVHLKKMVNGVWHDSRKVVPGGVFVAIRSERDDGHDYIDAAFNAGAIAAIVENRRDIKCISKNRKKLILVSNPLKAVQKAAARYRKEMGILFIGVTGSNGKTTTRTFISSVLRQELTISETYGNWNNHIGVPLSILKFTGDEWAGVIEMGANHVNEIHELTSVVKPDIAVITNIGYGHVGLFGALANTTRAKFEIADGLSKNGFLLLNGDDPRLVRGAKQRGLRTVFYGMSKRCDIRPQSVAVDPVHGVSFMLDGTEFRLSMPGRHFIYSALPAIYIGRRCGISDSHIAEALAAQHPVSMRGTIEKKKGVSFIVDCYNANPSSMSSSIVYLTDVSNATKRVAIVGDMLELGKYSKKLHRDLGCELVRAGVGKLIAVGEFAKDVADAAKMEGLSAEKIFVADNSESAVEIARSVIREGDIVLLKGSRGIHLETVFEKF
ncbi:MAG: UDP-N-acetylmuramoyl-tripeptide--D-alanyl-D-alanine ligase [Fibrobacter sp.]|nr:UDP-N-acetylmuramoyl-tripeptide--D-alanyl-D-alanine ligase [Fibrobacter sp.]